MARAAASKSRPDGPTHRGAPPRGLIGVVWDLLSGEPRALIEIKELEHAKNLKYDVTRDGGRVVVWCTDSVPFPNLVVVDIMSQNKISVYCHEGLVRQAVFTPDGGRIISSGSDNRVQVWDTFSLENLVTMSGHEGSVLCCAVNETATRVVSGGEDCTVRLWSLDDGKQLLAFQDVVRLWGPRDATPAAAAREALAAELAAVVGRNQERMREGPSVLRASALQQDGNVVVYDVVHGETVEIIVGHQNGPCRCVKLSADNREVLSCGADSKVVLWDWRKRAPLRIYSGHFISIGCCDISQNGLRVVSGDNHGMICVWEKDSGNSVQTLPLAHSRAVLSVTISADGSTIASVGADDKGRPKRLPSHLGRLMDASRDILDEGVSSSTWQAR
ncbi:WD repeat domain-containing protein [Tetrabaena socialis]|uniref:WD repeat domain-containing protein n=1 Tax=Tetrabaena socialis TaxID=47790 RepID=A0A2J8A1N9_9CHLO|nr:WD repeat domain-containing protein [Tetrabaena socialis]|eukprot:PNH06420.1 WD repeat domain-containing protein [Tetrabaena socialis]